MNDPVEPLICPQCNMESDRLDWCREDEEFIGEIKFCSRECAQRAYFAHYNK